MKKIFAGLAALVMALLVAVPAINAQNYPKKLRKDKGIEITYQSSFKGRVSPVRALMNVCGHQAAITTLLPDGEQPQPGSLIQATYIDYNNNTWCKTAILPDGDEIASIKDFTPDKGFTFVRDEKLLGLTCKVVRTVINSNNIEVWFTTDLPFRGTPQPNVGVPDGLVLKVVRNGDTVQEATGITGFRDERNLFPASWGRILDDPEYLYTINQSGVIKVPVFDQQRINFSGAKIPESLADGEIYNVGGGTIILRKVQLPDSAEISNRDIFAEVVQYSDGDAYDRTGSIFVIPTDRKQSFIDALRDLKSVPGFTAADSTTYHGLVSTPDYEVPLELMRFFTGFGVRAYNHNKVPGQEWADSVLYKTEITSLADHLNGEQWVGAYIGNWDGKGHKLSLNLKYYPSGSRKQFTAVPLFNTVNYLEQAGQPYPVFMLNDSLTVEFTLDNPVENAYLSYTTTGHGGWGGGDEFNQKINTILLDGEKVISFIPWREDCGTYRNWNPCSGNFSNGLSSSDLSRSNWCPGTVTNPEYIYLGNLAAGKHTITVAIPQGAPAAGSNSYWCISGTLLY